LIGIVIAGRANPIELLPPVRRSRHHAQKNVVTFGLGDENPHLMTLLGQAQIHRRHVTSIADREKPHAAFKAQRSSESDKLGRGSGESRGVS
jgi:hypothetical protein